MRVLKAVCLFSGAGGCSLGFQQAQHYEILAAYDNNKYAISTYSKNFKNNRFSLLDLSTCNFSELRATLGVKKGELDIIIGGPPCQGFSSAGLRFWDDPRNRLIRNYVEALKEFYPRWFFLENVEGILTTANGDYIVNAVEMFTELGYSLMMEKVYAQEYGVPQRRKRVIIIGNRTGIRLSFPTPQYVVGGAIFRNSSLTLRHSIEDLEDAVKPEIDHKPKFEKGIHLQRITALKQGQTMKDLPEELQHESFKKRAFRRVMDGTPSDKRGGAPSGLKRLVYDEPSLTITGAATREFIHPTKDRPLTIRECARIQTFPDSFIFEGSESEKIKQIGNAIPPALARVFAEHIFKLDNSQGTSTTKTSYLNPGLISFNLTKADAMSPALEKTWKDLSRLCVSQPGDIFYGIN